MAEAIVWDQIESAPPERRGLRYTLDNPNTPLGMTVEITPNVPRRHNSTPGNTRCDRVRIAVSPYERDNPDTPDCMISEFEVPVTEPPRDRAEFDTLAQGAGQVAMVAASATFALYKQLPQAI